MLKAKFAFCLAPNCLLDFFIRSCGLQFFLERTKPILCSGAPLHGNPSTAPASVLVLSSIVDDQANYQKQ